MGQPQMPLSELLHPRGRQIHSANEEVYGEADEAHRVGVAPPGLAEARPGCVVQQLHALPAGGGKGGPRREVAQKGVQRPLELRSELKGACAGSAVRTHRPCATTSQEDQMSVAWLPLPGCGPESTHCIVLLGKHIRSVWTREVGWCTGFQASAHTLDGRIPLRGLKGKGIVL